MHRSELAQTIEKPINSIFQLFARARMGEGDRARGDAERGEAKKSIEELILYIFQQVALPPPPPRTPTLQARRLEARP